MLDVKMLNVKAIIVSNMTSHCAGTVQMREESENEMGRERKKRCDLSPQQKMEREGAAVMCDGRLFHRRAAVTGNVLSLTVDRQVRRTSRDVDKAECSRCLASVCWWA